MTPDEMKDIAIRYTAAWNSQDPASVAEFFAEDGVLYVNGSPSEGRDAITLVAEGFMTAFPDMALNLDRLEFRQQQGIYYWTFIGTNTGPEGTGMAVNFSGHEEWTFNGEGLIAKSVGTFNEEEYQYQLEHGVDSATP